MKTYTIIQRRTYTTHIDIQADSKEEAERRYYEMVNDGSAYDMEMEQMNVDFDEFEIQD